jgi:hypothetical protein
VHHQRVNENGFVKLSKMRRVGPCFDLGYGRGRGLVVAQEAGFPQLVGVDCSSTILERLGGDNSEPEQNPAKHGITQ